MPIGAARLGFNFLRISSIVDVFPEYTKADLDALGITPSNTQYIVDNKHIKYTVNGNNSGALGDNTTGIGLFYAPNGDGNYGVDDYITPGNPWETYAVQTNTDLIGGSNASTVNIPTSLTQDALVYAIGGDDNHYIILKGNASIGWVIVQYKTLPGEAIIRMKMTYENTTGTTQYIQMLRAVDPDVDVGAYGSYNTFNQRGYGPISASDLVYSRGLVSNKPLSLYAPGNGYTHNSAILTTWVTYFFNDYLNNTETSTTGDHAIGMAWDIGNVAPGETASVNCYYICGENLSDIVAAIAG